MIPFRRHCRLSKAEENSMTICRSNNLLAALLAGACPLGLAAAAAADPLTFLDVHGAATTTYLEGETLRIRFEPTGWYNFTTGVDQTQVEVTSPIWGLDYEILTLTETAYGSRVFEGTLATRLDQAFSGNGVLEIGRGSSLDSVLVTRQGESAEAHFVAARLRLLDRLDREIGRLAIGQSLAVEVEKLTGNDPLVVDVLTGSLTVERPDGGDGEAPALVETGPATGIFRALLPTAHDGPWRGDGTLQLDPYQELVEVRYEELPPAVEKTLEIFENEAPWAYLGGFQMAAGESRNVALNYSHDPEGKAVSLGAVLGGSYASTTIEPDGSLTVTAAADARGSDLLTVLITDEDGVIGEAPLFVVYRSPPTITILGPPDGTLFGLNDTVELRAYAYDLDDGELFYSVQWIAEHFMTYGAISSFPAAVAGEGTHRFTVSAYDSDHNWVHTGPLTIEIDGPPRLRIHFPNDEASILPAGYNTLSGDALDVIDGDLGASIVWTSMNHGPLGTGASPTVYLPSAGRDYITATVTDSAGNTVSVQQSVSIAAPPANTAPVVAIAAPAAGGRFAQGQVVGFAATAADAESGDLAAGLVWTSSRDGVIGSGPSFSTGGLSLGSHLITAAVDDPQGLAGSASVSLAVDLLATATFVSIGAQDGFVLESGEESNAGGIASNGQLRLGDNIADRQYRSFLSFDTSALPDTALVTKVTVKAYRSGTTGVNPATTHGKLTADVETGFFGTSAALENADFQDAATVTGTCQMTPAAAPAQWSTGIFDAAGRAAINLAGTTQVRLQLAEGDDDDGTSDFLDHYGGESTVASTRPQLVVEYLP
jgi:hypothetical protein